MSWDGYVTYDEVEIINVERTEAYAAALPSFIPVFNNTDLHTMLGHSGYTDPATDLADWYDPDVPASADFYGMYPLEIAGIDNSSRGSTPIEDTIDGGTPGTIRHAMKSVVFNVLLLGASEAAVDYGIDWVTSALLGQCGSPTRTNKQPFGLTLEYLNTRPEMDLDDTTSPVLALNAYRRYLRRVTFNAGPTVNSRRSLGCGSAVAVLTFTGIAGTPARFGFNVPVLQGFPTEADPWVPGITPGTTDTQGYIHREIECGDPIWSPLYDPECPAPIQPPFPPSVPLACYDLSALEDEVLTSTTRNPSFVTDANLWTTVGTGVTIPRITGSTFSDGITGRVTLANAIPLATVYPTGTGGTGANRHPATPGQFLHSRFFVKALKALEVRVRQVPAAGTTDLADAGATAWIPMAVDEELVVQVADGVAPATTNGWRPLLEFRPSGGVGNFTTGNLAEVDLVSSFNTNTNRGWADVPYFTGDNPDDIDDYVYAWTGTANASTSTRTDSRPNWRRRTATIPPGLIPLWTEMLPVLNVSTEVEIRNTRIRLYRDPDGTLDPDDNPCAFDVDYLITYLPEGATLTIDTTEQAVWVTTVDGRTRRADSLVVATGGKPVDWSALSCGYGYVLTLDQPNGASPPDVDLSLVPRAA